MLNQIAMFCLTVVEPLRYGAITGCGHFVATKSLDGRCTIGTISFRIQNCRDYEMNLRILGVIAVFSLLVGCAAHPDTTGATAGNGGSAATSGPAPGSQEDLVANVGDRVFYKLNESTLSSDARGTLDRQTAWLGKYPTVAVQIAGNCDDRGTEEYNLALGQRRANAARDYLVAKGVSSGRISTISYGKDRPTALGDNEDAWQQNRNAITSVK
jgi:peptidoglycan-associated lipoprotein